MRDPAEELKMSMKLPHSTKKQKPNPQKKKRNKLISEIEAKTIAEFVIQKNPYGEKEEKVEHTQICLQYIINSRKSKKKDFKVDMLFRGKIPDLKDRNFGIGKMLDWNTVGL